jgi:hypothetical protein
LFSKEGIQWVAVLWEGGKTPRWMLADALRDFSDIRSVPVPDGQAFADAIYKMWANRLGKVLPA